MQFSTTMKVAHIKVQMDAISKQRRKLQMAMIQTTFDAKKTDLEVCKKWNLFLPV